LIFTLDESFSTKTRLCFLFHEDGAVTGRGVSFEIGNSLEPPLTVFITALENVLDLTEISCPRRPLKVSSHVKDEFVAVRESL
jgi:hypothetical protein